MTKTLRRLLLLPAAVVALFFTQALPAHASNPEFNFRMVYGGGPCMKPDSYWGWGTSVHAAGCDSSSNHWSFADVQWDGSKYRYRILWDPSGGCLIPNWNQSGSPVVVTNGTNVCNGASSQWYFNYLGNNNYQVVNVASGLVLDYDISGANRGLQLWGWLGGQNQMWFMT